MEGQYEETGVQMRIYSWWSRKNIEGTNRIRTTRMGISLCLDGLALPKERNRILTYLQG